MLRKLLLTTSLLAVGLGLLIAIPGSASAASHHGPSHGPHHDEHHRPGPRYDHDHHPPHVDHRNYSTLPYNVFWKLVAIGRIPRP
jgi:hypothetical protein